LSVCDADAANNTLVNGKNLPKKRTRILNHLDRITFAFGNIYVFFYPLLNKVTKAIVEKNEEENKDLDMDTRIKQAQAEIQDTGIPDFTTTQCLDYPDHELDKKAVDWDMAFQEVEDGERAKREKQEKEVNQKMRVEAKKNQQALEEQRLQYE